MNKEQHQSCDAKVQFNSFLFMLGYTSPLCGSGSQLPCGRLAASPPLGSLLHYRPNQSDSPGTRPEICVFNKPPTIQTGRIVSHIVHEYCVPTGMLTVPLVGGALALAQPMSLQVPLLHFLFLGPSQGSPT